MDFLFGERDVATSTVASVCLSSLKTAMTRSPFRPTELKQTVICRLSAKPPLVEVEWPCVSCLLQLQSRMFPALFVRRCFHSYSIPFRKQTDRPTFQFGSDGSSGAAMYMSVFCLPSAGSAKQWEGWKDHTDKEKRKKTKGKGRKCLHTQSWPPTKPHKWGGSACFAVQFRCVGHST